MNEELDFSGVEDFVLEDLNEDIKTKNEEQSNTQETESPEKKNVSKKETDDDIFEIDFEPSRETPSGSKKDSSVFGVMAQTLLEEGVISEIDKNRKIESAKDLIAIIDDEVQRKVKESIPESFKDLIDLKQNVSNIDEIVEHRKTIEYLKSINEEDLTEDLSETLYKEFLKLKGFDNEEINDELEELKTLKKLEDKTKKALPKLIKYYEDYEQQLIEKQKQEKELLKKQEEEYINSFKQSLEELKDFDGVPITKELKMKTLDSLFKQNHTLPSGEKVSDIIKARMEDPIRFDVGFALTFIMTKGFKDFSAFKSIGKQKLSKDIEDAVKINDMKRMGSKPAIDELGAEILNYIKL